MIKVTVTVEWGETYLDVYTHFKDRGKAWRLLSYVETDFSGPLADGDPEVCDDTPYGLFDFAEEIPPHLVDFINELTQKAHDRIALEKLKGPPR